jgi:hypothetical protein
MRFTGRAGLAPATTSVGVTGTVGTRRRPASRQGTERHWSQGPRPPQSRLMNRRRRLKRPTAGGTGSQLLSWLWSRSERGGDGRSPMAGLGDSLRRTRSGGRSALAFTAYTAAITTLGANLVRRRDVT